MKDDLIEQTDTEELSLEALLKEQIAKLPIEAQQLWSSLGDLVGAFSEEGEMEDKVTHFRFEEEILCKSCKVLPQVFSRGGYYKLYCSCGKCTGEYKLLSDAVHEWREINKGGNDE